MPTIPIPIHRFQTKAVNYIYKDTVLVANPTVGYKRTLVGQSPHLFNASASYRSKQLGLKSSVTYTMQGENLSAINNSHLGFNRYQANYHNLGLTIEKRFYKKFFITFKASNLLNSPITWYLKDENNTLVRKAYNYQNYSFEIKYSF